jgi:hypothetical protein
VVGSEDEAPPDHAIDFVIGHGQSLDWLQRGDAMIRCCGRRFEALEAVRKDVDKATD